MEHWVEFPKMGLKFNLPDTLVQFSLFGNDITIKWYGVMIASGFLLAVIYAFSRAKKFKLNEDAMFDVVIVSTLLAFVGARLYYVLFSEPAERAEFFAHPISILEVWNGGIAIYGGLIFAFVTGLWMCRVRKVDTLAMFDLCSIGFLIGQAIGRWGNFFNQEAYGGNTTLLWGMTGDMIQTGEHATSIYDCGLPVHPTFLYESLWCILGFVLLHILSVKAYTFKGKIFASYMVWYGTGRFFIEGLRTDSLKLGHLRVSQLVAVLAVISGVALWFVFKAAAEKAKFAAVSVEDGAEMSTIDIETPAEDLPEGQIEETIDLEEKSEEKENSEK